MTSATAMVTIVLAVVACVGLGIRHAVTGPARSDHMRSDFQEWAELRNYRSQFVELVRELERPEYGGGRVLGTFDHQVWAWWVTFRGGYSYLGDACTTNVGDTELERRVGELSSFLRMTRAEYEVFIRRRYIMIFWMSCSKYQATRTYSFAPRSDYSPADQRLIETAPPYLGFTVALPLSQLERLGSEFSSLPPRPSSRLDVVVLTKDTSTTRMEPPADEFELTFENRLFRVWSRKPAA